jgi:hypothetical protein
MDAADALESLRQDGFTLSAADGRLIVVPASRLTDEARTLIRQHRDAFLVILASEPPSQSAKVNTAPIRIPSTHPAPATAPNPDRAAIRAARLNRMAALGITLIQTDRTADRLAQRDDDEDERRMCLECTHLGERGRCIAAATGRIKGADRRLEPSQTVLQRCEAFGLKKGLT